MLALPNDLGVVELLLLAVGAAVASGTAWLVYARLAGVLPRVAARRPVALLLAASFAAGVGLAPFTAWRVGHDIRYTSKLSRPIAERIGAYENYLDGSVFDDLAREIPEGDTYYVDAAPEIQPERALDAFPTWALTALLPRRAVSSPADADWIVTWGIPPRRLGVPLSEVRILRKPRYGFPATYLARVA